MSGLGFTSKRPQAEDSLLDDWGDEEPLKISKNFETFHRGTSVLVNPIKFVSAGILAKPSEPEPSLLPTNEQETLASSNSMPVKKKVPAKLDKQFGAFEQHSKGFSSRILKKFGFQGSLGKDGQGTADYIEVQLRPKNAGLGSINELLPSEVKRQKELEQAQKQEEARKAHLAKVGVKKYGSGTWKANTNVSSSGTKTIKTAADIRKELLSRLQAGDVAGQQMDDSNTTTQVMDMRGPVPVVMSLADHISLLKINGASSSQMHDSDDTIEEFDADVDAEDSALTGITEQSSLSVGVSYASGKAMLKEINDIEVNGYLTNLLYNMRLVVDLSENDLLKLERNKLSQEKLLQDLQQERDILDNQLIQEDAFSRQIQQVVEIVQFLERKLEESPTPSLPQSEQAYEKISCIRAAIVIMMEQHPLVCVEIGFERIIFEYGRVAINQWLNYFQCKDVMQSIDQDIVTINNLCDELLIWKDILSPQQLKHSNVEMIDLSLQNYDDKRKLEQYLLEKNIFSLMTDICFLPSLHGHFRDWAQSCQDCVHLKSPINYMISQTRAMSTLLQRLQTIIPLPSYLTLLYEHVIPTITHVFSRANPSVDILATSVLLHQGLLRASSQTSCMAGVQSLLHSFSLIHGFLAPLISDSSALKNKPGYQTALLPQFVFSTFSSTIESYLSNLANQIQLIPLATTMASPNTMKKLYLSSLSVHNTSSSMEVSRNIELEALQLLNPELNLSLMEVSRLQKSSYYPSYIQALQNFPHQTTFSPTKLYSQKYRSLSKTATSLLIAEFVPFLQRNENVGKLQLPAEIPSIPSFFSSKQSTTLTLTLKSRLLSLARQTMNTQCIECISLPSSTFFNQNLIQFESLVLWYFSNTLSINDLLDEVFSSYVVPGFITYTQRWAAFTKHLVSNINSEVDRNQDSELYGQYKNIFLQNFANLSVTYHLWFHSLPRIAFQYSSIQYLFKLLQRVVIATKTLTSLLENSQQRLDFDEISPMVDSFLKFANLFDVIPLFATKHHTSSRHNTYTSVETHPSEGHVKKSLNTPSIGTGNVLSFYETIQRLASKDGLSISTARGASSTGHPIFILETIHFYHDQDVIYVFEKDYLKEVSNQASGSFSQQLRSKHATLDYLAPGAQWVPISMRKLMKVFQ